MNFCKVEAFLTNPGQEIEHCQPTQKPKFQSFCYHKDNCYPDFYGSQIFSLYYTTVYLKDYSLILLILKHMF